MNILNRLTIKNLKLNKKRTIVTIIGIILSTALICAIAGMATSFQKSMLKMAIAEEGDYHVSYLSVPEKEMEYIKNNRNIKSFYQTNSLGYAPIQNRNEYKPYIYLVEYDANALKQGSINIIEGRLPENTNEIILPEHLCDYGFNCKIGSKLTLNVGKRVSLEGNELNQFDYYYDYDTEDKLSVISEEKIINQVPHEYTIVGIMSRVSYILEDGFSPGYYSITFNNNINSSKSNIYVKYKNPKKALEELCKTVATTSEDENKCLDDKDYNQKFDYDYNSEVLSLEGAVRADNTKDFLYGIIAFIIGIVVVSSILVIRNSFSISITERYKQYGMLASIGATKKQIRKNVLFEALILGLIGIPLGVLLGVVADVLLVYIVNFIVRDANLLTRNVNQLLWLSVPILPILISIIVSGMTILLSALIPALKVSRISPMEAIKSNNDIKIKAKKLKSSKFIKTVFGIGGEIANKNLKRSKKKYRTTIISIVVSVVIFIALSSLVEYGFKLSNTYYTKTNYNVSVSLKNFEEVQEDNIVYDKLLQEYSNISKLEGVEKFATGKTVVSYIDYKYENDDFIKYMYSDMSETEIKQIRADSQGIPVYLMVFNDEEYDRLTKGLDLSDDDKKSGAILVDKHKIYEDNKVKETNFLNIKQGDNIVFTFDNKSKIELPFLKEANIEDSLVADEFFGVSFIVSNDYAQSHPEVFKNCKLTSLYLKSSDSKNITKYIDNFNASSENFKLEIDDLIETVKQNNAMVLIISIFLYGFIAVISLIGVTNIFNVITTNMMLRSKEFAMLKAIGMTDKEFKKMIWLESLLYGLKSLVIGLIIGLLLSYKIFNIFATNIMNTTYVPPIKAIIISIIFVMFIIIITMRYSFNKINKQNIIETIRNDNI